jgi:hypothetical protein
MKQIITKITLTIFSSSLIIGCSSSNSVAPSQNSALNSVSNSTAAKPKNSYIQKAMDNWLTNDWAPTVSQDKNIQKKYMQKDESTTTTPKEIEIEQKYIRKDGTPKSVHKEEIHYVEKSDKPFTLQEYVDKATAYQKAKPNDYEHSNVKKLESMPVIGK